MFPARWVLAICVAVTAAHTANLAYLGGISGFFLPSHREEIELSALGTRDSIGYLAKAEVIADSGFLAVDVHRKPPGLPFLLFLSNTLTGSPLGFLWLVPFAIGLAAATAARLAWELSGSRWAAFIAASLFGLWPGVYEFAPLLLTDALHGCLLVVTTYATYRWLAGGATGWSVAAALLWPSLLWLRSTMLFAVFLMMGFIVVSLIRRRKIHWGTWLILATTLSVPLYMTVRNAQVHDLPVITAIGAENLSCFAISRTRAEMGEGEFKPLRAACFDKYRDAPPSQSYPAQTAEFFAFARSHTTELLSSFASEVIDQTGYPVRVCRKREFYAQYPRWIGIPREGVWSFWCISVLGLCVVGRKQPWLAAWCVVCFLGIMGTASIGSLVGPRLRIPLDFLFIPIVAIGLDFGRQAAARGLLAGLTSLRP